MQTTNHMIIHLGILVGPGTSRDSPQAWCEGVLHRQLPQGALAQLHIQKGVGRTASALCKEAQLGWGQLWLRRSPGTQQRWVESLHKASEGHSSNVPHINPRKPGAQLGWGSPFNMLFLRWALTSPGLLAASMEDIMTMLLWAAMLTSFLWWGTKDYHETLTQSFVFTIFILQRYDEQSQMWGSKDCIARANAPLRKTFHGVCTLYFYHFRSSQDIFYDFCLKVRQYLHLGISPAKMVLGVPWYGYRYLLLVHFVLIWFKR